MTATEGQIYRCQNRHCNAEIHVIRPPIENLSNFKCRCGADMKKPYAAPTLHELKRETSSPMLVELRLNES
jgi:hypothetical protein